MPVSSYTGNETLEGRHKDAKFNIRQIIDVLRIEKKIEIETAQMLIAQLGRIEDDALSLFQSYAGKKIQFSIGHGKDKKYYEGEIIIEEKKQ